MNDFLKLSDGQKNRTKIEWERIAGEELTFDWGETVQDAIYVFGSELATLRLFKKFHGGPCKAGYSENLKSFYFCNK
jgi:hypothetical protein